MDILTSDHNSVLNGPKGDLDLDVTTTGDGEEEGAQKTESNIECPLWEFIAIRQNLSRRESRAELHCGD